MVRLAAKMQRRQIRLRLLDAYYRGDPPLPEGALNSREAYRQFQRKARSNFAELIVDATRERMAIAGFRTGAEGDDDGDTLAWEYFLANGLEVGSADVHENMLAKGDGYAIVGGPDPDTGIPVVTTEDPTQVVTAHDPARPQQIIASLKLFNDDTIDVDFAFLYRPGRVFVATRPRRAMGGAITFNASGWSWSPEHGGEAGLPIPQGAMPVVRFRNKRGLGEYETHTDLLDRINHMILQRMQIATVQAFRQRAIKGLPDVYPAGHPLAGQAVDYAGIFTADPGALWQLPATAEMWESGQVDLTPILSSVKDDVQHLAAVTRTPMHYFTPDAANGSAEGAQLMREGLVFKAMDRMNRASMGWRQVMSLMFRFAGDDQRADIKGLQVMWTAPDRYSLAERASAASQLSQIVPQRGIWMDTLQVDPQTAERYDTWRTDDMILSPQVARAVVMKEDKGTDTPVVSNG
jgi:hypothetical protein